MIAVRSSGFVARDQETVGQFLDRLGYTGRDRQRGLEVLRQAHARGEIGFRQGKEAEPVRRDTGQVPQKAADERSWPGTKTQRNLDRDKVQIDDSVLGRGLFRDKEHVRETTRSLLAGVPDAERLNVRWDYNPFSETIEMIAENKAASAYVERRFSKLPGGGWSVDHYYFTLPDKYQGGGNSKKMMRASVEEYDRLGVKQITVHANINVGGYAWAKLGFTPNDPQLIRENMERGIAITKGQPIARAVRKVLDTSSDDDLMYNLARTRGDDGKDYGREIFGPNSNWHGHLDLTDGRARERLGSNFRS